ncbi:acetolactate synthase-1/2/3 large subunit [Aminobacter lissarensis]|uniref:Acetolactate synthase-1/2/3 large subunit n=1 Tax=Aminobacter carboxidus TaxID=376165 RepID=A0A8E1WBZ5_9HYPH|nr:acetolactate synthase large subunit [Aminobacter lissarensis]MBB6465617.1 acetolactate synthase-1/2/3 large subunit [Aminobacter lissarensis]
MNGADMLCDVLLTNGVDVCFANPGTSEMHFVAALDRKPQMRCVLGLSEGVVTGAADGYARMADKPAATLLHLGPGLANGLANLHNARRARTPMLNIVGDHASYHLQHDAPLTSDIESLARPMSHWVGRVAGAQDVRPRTEEAFRSALMLRGISTMILPADAAWGEVGPADLAPVTLPERPVVSPEALGAAAAALRSGKRTVIILAGRALRAGALETAGRISSATGAALFSQTSDRTERGAGRVAARPVPYNIDLAVEALREFEVAICVGGKQPVGFFAYPHKPSTTLQPGCAVIELAGHEHDLAEALNLLAETAGVRNDVPFTPNRFTQPEIVAPTGALNADSITIALARTLPENAIICEESITSAGKMAVLAPGLSPHDHIPLTGGAIGIGIPLATGAAIACPDRKVIALQADGSGMYTLQGLWTQARENLDVVTVIFANRNYAILQGEMRNVGVKDFGRNARRMLDLDNPDLDWCSLARGMGVEAARVDTIDGFTDTLKAALAQKGPFLIEARI